MVQNEQTAVLIPAQEKTGIRMTALDDFAPLGTLSRRARAGNSKVSSLTFSLGKGWVQITSRLPAGEGGPQHGGCGLL